MNDFVIGERVLFESTPKRIVTRVDVITDFMISNVPRINQPIKGIRKVGIITHVGNDFINVYTYYGHYKDIPITNVLKRFK